MLKDAPTTVSEPNPDRTGPDRMGPDRTGLDRTGLDRTVRGVGDPSLRTGAGAASPPSQAARDAHSFDARSFKARLVQRWGLAGARLGRMRAAAELLQRATRQRFPRVPGVAWLSRHPLVARVATPVWSWLRRTPPWRFFTKTLLRRILISNSIGLVLLLGGAGLLGRNQQWLVDAKVESLSAQARMVAVAIASNAKVERDNLTLDPDRLPDIEGTRAPFRDDSFAALELSIAPERVAPILRRLIQTGGIRARIYDQSGTLIVDSASIFVRSPSVRPDTARPDPGRPDATRAELSRTDLGVPIAGEERTRVRNAWTRTWAWFLGSQLPVYREIGAANGTSYPEVREALAGQMTRMLLLSDAGEQIVTVAAPIQQRRTIQGVVLLSSLPGEIDRLLAKERQAYLTLAVIAALAALVTSLLLARTIAGPMQKLSNAADNVSVSVAARSELPDLTGRQDEIGRMAQSFNGMTAALLRRIEASDRFAQDVAHELKNPVAAARSTAEALAYAKTDERREHLVKQIKGELVRLNRLISDVANASRLDAELALQQTEPLDLGTIAGNVVGVMRDLHSESGISLTLAVDTQGQASDAFVVRGHEGRLNQVMTNLIDNALSFSPRDSTVRVTLARSLNAISVVIEDHGPGIPPNKLNDVFNRFYSDRPQTDQKTGKNSGLGLSITREIVEAHGGHVWAENRPLTAGEQLPAEGREHPGLADRRIPGVAGARFTVRLPAFYPDPKKR